MAIDSNTFNQSVIAGMVDLQIHSSVVEVQVAAGAPDVSTADAVKLEDSAGGVPKVLAITSNFDSIFGFVTYVSKNSVYKAGQALELALRDTVIYLTASGAIPRGALVKYDYVAKKISVYTGLDGIGRIGWAYDKAAVDGDIIRVMLDTPIASAVNDQSVKTVNVVATLAQINAGLTIIPAVAGKKIRVVNFNERVNGAFAATTSVDLQSDATNVKVETTAVAGLTNGANLGPYSANVTIGVGFGADLPVGEGLKVANVGAAATTGVSITYTVSYIQAA